MLSPLSRPLPQPMADGWHPLCLGWNSTSVGAICTSPYQVLGPLGGHFKCLLGLRETSERLVMARLEIFLDQGNRTQNRLDFGERAMFLSVC